MRFYNNNIADHRVLGFGLIMSVSLLMFSATTVADETDKLVLSANSSSSFNSSNKSLNKTTLDVNTAPSILKASIKQIQGTVLINHGKGYSQARLDMGLRKSDRVMAMNGASAVVVQDNGCVIKLKQNSIYMLDNYVNCQLGTESIKKSGPIYARAIGAEAISDVPVEPVEPVTSQQDTPVKIVDEGFTDGIESGSGSFFSDWSTTQIVVTGVAVGLGLAVAGSGGSSNGAISGQ